MHLQLKVWCLDCNTAHVITYTAIRYPKSSIAFFGVNWQPENQDFLIHSTIRDLHKKPGGCHSCYFVA